jgi:hypothetical protein
MNDPIDYVDPLGLREDMPGQCPQVTIDGNPVYDDFGGCAVGGWLVRAILSMDAGAICPDGGCSQIQWNAATGQWQQWVPPMISSIDDGVHLDIGYWIPYDTNLTSNSSIDWGGLWLQTRVFFQALANNWHYVLQHDCAARFVQRVAGDYVPGAPSTDDLVRQGSAATATTYQMAKGLTVPMRSSIYRGILTGGEKLAGWVAVGEFIHSEWNSLKEEVQEVKEGACQAW